MKTVVNLDWICLRHKASIFTDEGLSLKDLQVTLLRPKLSSSGAQASELLGMKMFVGTIASGYRVWVSLPSKSMKKGKAEFGTYLTLRVFRSRLNSK